MTMPERAIGGCDTCAPRWDSDALAWVCRRAGGRPLGKRIPIDGRPVWCPDLDDEDGNRVVPPTAEVMV